MENFILVEYFTSKSNLKVQFEKNLISEALNICDSITLNFAGAKKLSKLRVIRNKTLRTIKSEKIEYLFTNDKINMTDILRKVKKNSKVIFIAPESEKKSFNIHLKFGKYLNIFSSDLKCMEIFSSKIKTLDELNKFKLPVVEFHKNSLDSNNLVLTKPEYGAGSCNVVFTNNLKKKKKFILQKFYEGIKGSFLMLCNKGKCKVICCNEQIVKINRHQISQIGCIMGGLEEYREEIETLAKKICANFKGLFGVIGVDIVRENKKWLILEINPRFTSAYCGLKNSYNQETIDEITNFYLEGEFSNLVPKLLKKVKYIF